METKSALAGAVGTLLLGGMALGLVATANANNQPAPAAPVSVVTTEAPAPVQEPVVTETPAPEPTVEPAPVEVAPVVVEPAPVAPAPVEPAPAAPAPVVPVPVAPAPAQPAPAPVEYVLPPATAVADPVTYAANGDPNNAGSKD